MDWESAGRAWSEGARDWAYLMEPFARPANDVVFDRLGVGPGMRLVDVACGSGYAASVAAQRGATVAGLDASEGLIAITAARTPDGDFRVGDMAHLPFGDEQFDVATSFAGIVSNDALDEVWRVLRPGGVLGLAGWGSPRRRQHLAYFMALVDISPTEHIEDSVAMMSLGRPGVFEEMLGRSGLEVLERGSVDVTSEWPDPATAVKALAAAGPSWPAIQLVGQAKFTAVMTEAMEAVNDEAVGIRLSSEYFWVTARKPA